MSLFIPELEQYAQKDKLLYEILVKITNAINSSPVVRGKGNPEGVVSARPGTLFLSDDPLMGDMAYVKVSGNEATGWAVLANAGTGTIQGFRSVSGSTSSTTFVTVASIEITCPLNIRKLAFTLDFTGTGTARIKIGNVLSNEVTANGTVTLFNPPTGVKTLEVQAKASAGSVTATLQIKETTFLAGSQLSGSRADSGAAGGTSAPSPTETSPIDPRPERAQIGDRFLDLTL